MGCGSSLNVRSKVADKESASNQIEDNSPLTPEQIRQRIVSSETSIRLKITQSISIEYAFVSQRGYYPDG